MIIRVKKGHDPYARIDKVPINDKRLSYKSLGLLTYLLSKPDDWKVMEVNLVSSHGDGRDSVRTGLQQLIKAGYIERKMERENGRYVCVEYTVHERPIKTEEEPKTEIPATGNPMTGNLPLLTNDKALTNELTKKTYVGKADPAEEVLTYLNEKSRTPFPMTKTHLKNIHGRMKDGYEPAQMKLVIDFKAAQWQNDDTMWEYLRPKTLFGPENFVGYLTGAEGWDKKGRPRLNKKKKSAVLVDDRRDELVRGINDRLAGKRS